MERYHSRRSLVEPAMYRISILGTLDKQWSDYCGGMTIEHDTSLKSVSDDNLDRSIIRPICVDWGPQFTIRHGLSNSIG